MAVKDKLLTLLEENKGAYLSGEEIAGQLNVSRTAVWKAVNGLRDDGYEIRAISNKGYCLSNDTDILSLQGVKRYLNSECGKIELDVKGEVGGSTNDIVKKTAEVGKEAPFCLVAGGQSAGKGRVGRSFYSPSGTGIYLSLLLRPQGYTAENAVSITTIAAVAACEAIEAVTERKALIKWVNDIYIDNKKVCGILTEASFNLETLFLDYAVMGIGFNAYTPNGGFPEEIKDRAGSIFTDSVSDGKNKLSAEFLNRFMHYYNSVDKSEYVKEYQKRSFVVGRSITVVSAKGERSATAQSVDDLCRLVVKYEDGSTEALSSGEISIRL